MLKNSNGNKAFLLTEILIVAAAISLVTGALIGAAYYSLKLSSISEKTTVALTLAQESLESLRSFRNGTDWSSGLGALASGLYHIEKTGSGWAVLPGEESTGDFSRKINVENVSRNPATGMIEEIYNPANNDPETKKTTAVVSWESGAKQIQITAFFTNWK